MKIIVLGAGLVGAPMAIDLNKDEKFEVTVADRSDDALNSAKVKCPELSTIQKDLSNPEDVTVLMNDYDLVVNAVPGFMGFETAKAIIKAGKNSACIAFYEEDPFVIALFSTGVTGIWAGIDQPPKEDRLSTCRQDLPGYPIDCPRRFDHQSF